MTEAHWMQVTIAVEVGNITVTFAYAAHNGSMIIWRNAGACTWFHNQPASTMLETHQIHKWDLNATVRDQVCRWILQIFQYQTRIQKHCFFTQKLFMRKQRYPVQMCITPAGYSPQGEPITNCKVHSLTAVETYTYTKDRMIIVIMVSQTCIQKQYLWDILLELFHQFPSWSWRCRYLTMTESSMICSGESNDKLSRLLNSFINRDIIF